MVLGLFEIQAKDYSQVLLASNDRHRLSRGLDSIIDSLVKVLMGRRALDVVGMGWAHGGTQLEAPSVPAEEISLR